MTEEKYKKLNEYLNKVGIELNYDSVAKAIECVKNSVKSSKVIK